MHHAEQNEGRQHGGTAAGYKGQSQSHNRQQSQTHTEVLCRLRDQHRRNPHADVEACIVACLPPNPQDSPDHDRQHRDDEQSADKAEFLAYRGEDEVGV